MLKIREFQTSDWVACWQMMKPIFRAGETYPYSPQITEKEAYNYWINLPLRTYVAEMQTKHNREIVGSYYIKPNQPTLGAHVCNCGYITAQKARGKGVATALCEHSQSIAPDLGFRAMQFNLVVSTNQNAVNLWNKLGFTTIGRLPNAFHCQKNGYVDAFIMYKELR